MEEGHVNKIKGELLPSLSSGLALPSWDGKNANASL